MLLTTMETANIDLWFWVLLTVLLLVAYWYVGGPKNLPPGSAGLPVVGYLPFMDKLSYLTFDKLSRKYGNVFHLYFGNRLVVVLNDYSSIHEAFVRNADVFSGRPHDNVFKESSTANLGLTANEGEYWKQHRRFILSNLKSNGFGALNMEPLILEEINYFMKELRENAGKIVDIKPLLMRTTSNNVNILITGKRFDYNSPELRKLISIMNTSEHIPTVSLNSFFPWLAKLPGSNKLLKREAIRNYFDGLDNAVAGIIQSTVNDHAIGLDDNYIHAFLTEKYKRQIANGTDENFTDLSLRHLARSMLLAGTETTATTLHFSLLHLTMNPEIQKKVQDEIDAVIGAERLPSYNDRTKMPYTEATIMEVYRMSSAIPLSIPHRNREEVRIQGHNIPKGTMVIPNLWSVHHDEKFWGDPHTFRPERFIGSDGQFVKAERIITFSLGKRACIGEPLVRMETFLYLVSLLQIFTFVPPNGEKPTLDPYPGIVIRPKFRNICAVLRK